MKARKTDIFRIAKQMKMENQDILDDNCGRNDEGDLAVGDENLAWVEHCHRLLNIEFPFSVEDLLSAEPVAGPATFLTLEMVTAAVSKQKDCQAPGPSGFVAEMLKASSEVTTPLRTV